jgi:hypothetical protein
MINDFQLPIDLIFSEAIGRRLVTGTYPQSERLELA